MDPDILALPRAPSWPRSMVAPRLRDPERIPEVEERYHGRRSFHPHNADVGGSTFGTYRGPETGGEDEVAAALDAPPSAACASSGAARTGHSASRKGRARSLGAGTTASLVRA